jgi:hypothetical protein
MKDMTSGEGPEGTARREPTKGRVDPVSEAATPAREDPPDQKAPVSEHATAHRGEAGRPGTGTAPREGVDPAAAESIGPASREVAGIAAGESTGGAAHGRPTAPDARPLPQHDTRQLFPHDTRVLPQDECDKFSLRLRHAVGGFVDGPRDSVEEADHVLEELAARFTDAVARRRGTLRTSWQETADTEQLRLTLRDYREVTERLLRL